MTHVKTAEAFARLIDFCTGYGGTYNPGRPTLQLPSLMNKLAEAREAAHQVMIARAQFDNAVNERVQEFNALPSLLSSIMRWLEASGASPEKVADARSYVHQFLGKLPRRQTVVIPAPDGEGNREVKVSRGIHQLAYVSKADAFAKLVQTVATEPLYLPNEQHLTVDALMQKITLLKQLNQNVSNAKVVWSNAIIARNQVLYKHTLSLVAMGRAVQRYVRAIFGLNSAQYAQIKVLRFNDER
jgi:hypothetical protein